LRQSQFYEPCENIEKSPASARVQNPHGAVGALAISVLCQRQ
jgi:hypothetical protein